MGNQVAQTALSANAGSIARLLAGVLGGILASIGYESEEGTLETIIGGIIVAGAGIWAIVKNARDKKAKVTTGVAGCLLPLGLIGLLLGTGCAGVYTPKISAFSIGLDSAQIMQGLNVTRNSSPTNDYYEVILDSTSGQQSSGKLVDGLIAVGEMVVRAKAGGGALPATEVVAPDESQVEVAPVKAKVKKPAQKKPATNKPKTTVSAASPALTAAMVEAKSSGKPLVVIASSPSCGSCKKFEDLLVANPAFAARNDMVFYFESNEWDVNSALSWTGGDAAPIVRITQWDATGKVVCNKKINRPPNLAAIEAAIDACDPK